MQCTCPSPEFNCPVCNGNERATFSLQQSTGDIRLPAILSFHKDDDAFVLYDTLKHGLGLSDIAYHSYGYLPYRRSFLYLFYLNKMELTEQDFQALLEEAGYSELSEEQKKHVTLLKG